MPKNIASGTSTINTAAGTAVHFYLRMHIFFIEEDCSFVKVGISLRRAGCKGGASLATSSVA